MASFPRIPSPVPQEGFSAFQARVRQAFNAPLTLPSPGLDQQALSKFESKRKNPQGYTQYEAKEPLFENKGARDRFMWTSR